MQLTPTVHLASRSRGEASGWEMGLRYAAATASTLLAIAGAQLVVPNRFVLGLLALTLLGVPVSIYLRLSDMRVGRWRLSRPLWNALTLGATFVASAIFIALTLGNEIVRLFGGMSTNELWETFGPDPSMRGLMQIFLIFATCRSFALITDKDAALSALSSFSVLLLLCPLHKGIEVVFYFLAWTVVAAMLFALDHRSELRSRVVSRVPAFLPGQDARLAARSLASILGLALVGAASVSFFLSTHDGAERSTTEVAISNLAARLTRYALSIPDVSTNAGPERRIDFSAAPALPGRTELWAISAQAQGGKYVTAPYWRMFTLSSYDGKSWSQTIEQGLRVRISPLDTRIFPPRQFFRPPDDRFFRFNRPGDRRPDDLRRTDPRISDRRDFNFRDFDTRPFAPRPFAPRPFAPRPFAPRPFAPRPFAPQFNTQLNPQRGRDNFNPDNTTPGFHVRAVAPEANLEKGSATVVVSQDIKALLPTVGYLPVLPAVRAVQGSDAVKEMRVRSDGGLNLGSLNSGEILHVISDVPELPEYGFGRSHLPPRRMTKAQIAASAIRLTPAQRVTALQLPLTLPRRVRDLGLATLIKAGKDENNLRRAERLALAIQRGATYTLHPPTPPEDRDATDYFLFDGRKRGYCTYFAGALTVLCRTQGIPARVVSGFVRTETGRTDATIFREANAHAWTEIWVEGWGWTVVDATPSDDRGENSPDWVSNWQNWFETRFTILQNGAQLHSAGLEIAAVGLLGCLALWRFAVPSLRRYTGRSLSADQRERRAVIETYRRVARQMTRHYRPRAASETPDEWLQAIAAPLSLPDIEALRRVTALYTAALYAHRPLPDGSGALARRTASAIAWKRVRP